MDFLFVELPETVKLGSFFITISNTNFWYKQHKGFNLLMGFFSVFHFSEKYSVSERSSPNLVPYKRRNQTLRCQHRFGSRAAECRQCLKCPERCRDTHIMLLILSRFFVTWSLVGSKTKNLQTSSIPVFRTHKLTPLNSVSRRQSVWHFEKSSVLSATKTLLKQNIAQLEEKVFWTILVASLDSRAFIRSGQDDPNVSLSPN